jgi:hypothetical protein
MNGKLLRFLDVAKRWVRYAYFLRFALALWLFAPLLCLLDRTGFKTIVSGVMTPETMQQYICVAFFLISAGFVALICARVVLINGPARYDKCYDRHDDGRPSGLKALLANDEGHNEWWALLASQLPNAGVYLYLCVNGHGQMVRLTNIGWGLFFGTTLALLVWYVVNGWYYLTYDPPDPTGIVEFGRNAARTLLLPRSFIGFGLHRPGIDRYSHDTIEGASNWMAGSFLDKFLTRIAKLASYSPGYSYLVMPPSAAEDLDGDASPEVLEHTPASVPRRRLYEGHVFGGLSALVFTGSCLLLWPLTAPVPALHASVVALVLLFLSCAALAYAILSMRQHPRWKTALTVFLILAYLSVLALYFLSNAERFPILATLLIIATTICWTFSGISFFLDLYRVPVLTSFLVVMMLPRLINVEKGHEEHYLSTVTGSQVQQGQSLPDVPEPRQLLQNALAANPDSDGPLIIVTATGGGLHASAWTAEILYRLEDEFDRQYPTAKGKFHQHLLLASTVSGGSAGLLTYLTALRQQQPGASPDFLAMRTAAQCSSLEAVGWGFVYWDLLKAVVPVLPYFSMPSSGVDDLGSSPLGKDRSWSLRKGFSRNANNDYCRETWRRDTSDAAETFQQWRNWNTKNRLKSNRDDDLANQTLEHELTLRNLQPTWSGQTIPAFTMNATAYEDGHRFLFANYRIPDPQNPPDSNWPDSWPNYKARSFIATYRTAKLPSGENVIADLPLATAAQASSAFPYISSAARVPWALDSSVQAYHFVDGGYYDNDGTASVAEFLRYALADCQDPKDQPNQDACEERVKTTPPNPAAHPVRILLIEIRNSGDDYGSDGELDPYHFSGARAPANLFNQLTAPLLGFWQAGHEGVTARNRAAISQLEHAFAGRLELHRVVFDDRHSTNEVGTDPLSWSLTPRQRNEVRDSADPTSKVNPSLAPRYKEALDWFSMAPQQWLADPVHKHYADSDWPE